MGRTPVLLAQDQQEESARLRSWIEAQPDFTVVGEARDSAQAIALGDSAEPVVVVVVVNVPLKNEGIEAAREIIKKRSWSRVVVQSSVYDQRLVTDALAAGVRGLLKAPAAEQDLMDSIREVAAGEFFFDRAFRRIVDTLLLEELVSQLRRRAGEDTYQRLTTREREIVELLVLGKPARKWRTSWISAFTQWIRIEPAYFRNSRYTLWPI